MITGESEPPTVEGMELDLLAAVQGGRTLARHEGQVVFITGGIAGESAHVSDLVRRRGYLEGAADTVSRLSPLRVTPPCRYFGENGLWRGSVPTPLTAAGGVCGGCQYQHIDYAGQQALKQAVLTDTLRRVGKIVDPPVGAPIPSPEPYGYRNKATWIVTEEGELAYYEARSRIAVPISTCLLLSPALQAVFDAVSAASAEIGLAGLAQSLEARVLTDPTGVDAAAIVLDLAPSTTSQEAEVLAEALTECCPNVRSVWGRAFAGTDGAREARPLLLHGEEYLETMFLGERLSISPTSFFQVNFQIAEAIATYVLEQCGTLTDRQALDVYSGVGLFTLPLARAADAVISLEVDEGAVAAARRSVAAAGLENVTLLQGDAALNLKAILPGSIQCAVVDPTRAGCSPETLHQLARIKARRLIYVSCDAATLARDLRVLLDNGYELETVRPFDLFPQTAHIESVSALRLPKKRRAKS